MSTPSQRHAAILRLIGSRRVPSQETLRELLEAEGHAVAQATLSRDLRSLGVVKATDRKGRAHYTVPPGRADASPRLDALLPTLFRGLDGVEHLLVLRTVAGGAHPVAAAIDQERWDEVAGTIAGDDTVLVVTRSPAAGERVRERISALADRPAE